MRFFVVTNKAVTYEVVSVTRSYTPDGFSTIVRSGDGGVNGVGAQQGTGESLEAALDYLIGSLNSAEILDSLEAH